jgi:tetratricopeptide (TPR) repeat protein
MGGSPLRASPTAVLLLDLAGRRATGRLAFGDRVAVLSEGELIDISPAGPDEPAGPRRALFIERLGAALRTAESRHEPVPVLEPALRSREPSNGVPFAPLVLDAVARSASESDLAWLALQRNHRITLREVPVSSVARAWAGIDLAFARPAVSTVLAKRPDAGPRLAALLRTGLAQLEAPGRTGPSQPPGTGTLPPPAPRLSGIPPMVPVEDAPDLLSQLSVRPPRLRLGPGQADDAGEPLMATTLPMLRPQTLTIEDPIEALEQRIAALEAGGAKGPERARAFSALADAWLQRLHSVERACRALREACAADPSDARTLQQTALYCHILGEPELALRYAEGAIHAAGIAVERASAQRLRAAVLRAQGRRDEMIEALCEAAADDPASPEPHELVATLLEPTHREGANAHARLAAAGFSDSQPTRALALLDWAFALLPADVPTVYEYASLLDAQGARNAAVAVLARAAELQTDPDARRKLRLSAAQRAEAAGRADRAAELLEDALDAEPHFDLLYAPLDEDLVAAGFPEHRAVVLEDIATACPEDQRALWLSRAAQALLAIPGQRESALWIAFEAALVDGLRQEPLQLLRAEAKQPLELVLLAYALRAAAATQIARGDKGSLPVLRELTKLALAKLDNPELALAALDQLERLDPSSTDAPAWREQATARARAREAELKTAEQALAEGKIGSPSELRLRVARLLPDLPEAWPRRIELLHEALASGAPRAPTADALLALYGLTRDAAGLAAFLEDQIDSATDLQERTRLLLRLAAVHTVREDAHAVAATCEQILAIDPVHPMAVARLLRSARRLGVPALWARALEHRARIATDAKQRARALARLSRAYELAGGRAEAAQRAIEALALDSGCADAAIVLLATASDGDPERVLPALKLVPKALCPSARAYQAILAAAEASNDRAEEARALDAWTATLPSDARAHERRLLRLPEKTDGATLHELAQTALTQASSEPVIDAVRGIIDRLERAGHEGLAARLCLRLCEEQGRADGTLLGRAAQLAKKIAPELRTRALELWACTVPERERTAVWLELAAHHAQNGDPLGEQRALLRVLELDVAHPLALDRLHALFLASGDVPRVLSVATLRLETQDEPAARRAGLIQLAALAGRLGKDLPRAELYVRRMVAESQGDFAHVRSALGVLLALGEPEWALARARTIADGCPEELRGRIYHACAATAEQVLKDRTLALELASIGARIAPNHAPLLLMVERISLDAGETEVALRTYDALIGSAIGPHGRRALVYRAGRWLERAGDLDKALDRYLEAFRLEPSAGAAFIALARVAQTTGKVDRTLACYEQLAAVVPHELTRVDLIRRAQDIALGPLDDPARALDILRKATTARDHPELSAMTERVAERLRERDPAAGKRAFATLVEDIERRAEQLWEGPDKVRSWLRIATIMGRELDEPGAALARADQAVDLVEREQLGMDLLAEALSERERIESMAIAAGVPIRSAPPELIEEPESAPPPAPPPREVDAEPETMRVPSITPAPVPSSVSVSASPSSVPPAPNSAPPAPNSAPPADRASAREQLIEILSREPYRADAIRKLHALCSHEPKSIESFVATALLAAFDSQVAAPAERQFHSGVWRGDALQVALADPLPAPARRVLARLWEASRTLPRFRMTAASAGLTERDRLAQRASGPVAEAYAQAVRLLGARDVPVFETAGEGPRETPRVIVAHPPFVLVHAALGASKPSRSALSWTFGRALQLAQPDQVFGAALPAHDARDLLHAARLAFAPASAPSREQATVTPQIKELAASLWQNVPAREQRDITSALQTYRNELSLEALVLRAEATSARAGLLCSGNITEALRSVSKADPKLAGLNIQDATVFAEACKRSAAYAATVSCAVSSELRAALALARAAR